MTLYWLSWCEPGEDFRLLTYPPPESIVAYWNTGEDGDGSTVVALVRAESLAAAWSAVKNVAAWPNAGKERFGHEYTRPELPPKDRFPPPHRSEPMMERWPWKS